VRRFHASFSYQAGSWTEPRRVVAKVEWHPGELLPRVGFIVTNLTRPAEGVVAFYNRRGTAEQWIKEGKAAVRWTRLSCRSFAANAVRLQLHALAYNLGTFMRTLALPEGVELWSPTTRRERLVKIGAKVVSHGRYVTFQMAEVAVPRRLFAAVLWLIDRLRAPPAPACGRIGSNGAGNGRERCAAMDGRRRFSGPPSPRSTGPAAFGGARARIGWLHRPQRTHPTPYRAGHPGNVR
jgi:hypothetical protein